MSVNRDKPDLWKADIGQSVDLYNTWFIQFAPKTFRETRVKTAEQVEFALRSTENLTNVTPELLKEHPRVLPMLRMSTCPPIARDRLVGLAGVSKNLVESMEDAEAPRIPPGMSAVQLDAELLKTGSIVEKMADPDIFVWLGRIAPATDSEVARAATIVADRLCGAVSDPIIRNAQEKRQLAAIAAWLQERGYTPHIPGNGVKFNQMKPGTYSFRMNVQVKMITDKHEEKLINIPVDAVIMPKTAQHGDFPLLIEAKSAGDFTNVNKRRKEEAQKMTQLRSTYGPTIRFGLFLCGYFDSGYLGYEAAEGIDWVWEHRIDDLTRYGALSMDKRSNNEALRLSVQAELDARKTALERNKLGQFATPGVLAREVLSYGLGLLPKASCVRFLDPAIGTGSFYSALREETGRRPIETAKGFEVDPHYGEPARELWPGSGLDIELCDFTKAAPPGDGFNLLICNPPYVRHHHLDAAQKRRLQLESQNAAGVHLSGLAGLYCHFIALAHRWMSSDGIAGWLIPGEFMDVNYGRELKRYLLEEVTLLRIHRFDPNDVQFDDALVSSAVVWFKKTKPPMGHEVEFSYGGSHTEPAISRQISSLELSRESKWTRFPRQKVRGAVNTPVLSDLFSIKRGIATGGNEFFILSKERIAELDLPMEFFRPVLPGPRYVKDDEIQADDKGNPILPRSLFLLNCSLPESVIKSDYPGLWRYLESGKEEMCSRYLCKSRPMWYKQEDRRPAPFVCTYMGRSDAGGRKPFRFLLNHSHAVVSNTYLMLYPKPHVAERMNGRPEMLRGIWEHLNNICPESLMSEGRVYGGGLHKMEPKELAKVPAGEIPALLNL